MIKVNLLSPEKKDTVGGAGPDLPSFDEEKGGKINVIAIIAAAVITIGIGGYMYYSQNTAFEERKTVLQEKEARKTQLDSILKTIEELERTKSNLEKKVKLITDLKNRQQDAVKMMDELLNAIPDWVWLNSLGFSNRLVAIRGTTLGNNLISDFINNLKGTNSFYEIDFPGSVRGREGGMDVFTFSINCKYKDKNEVKAKEPVQEVDKSKEFNERMRNREKKASEGTKSSDEEAG